MKLSCDIIKDILPLYAEDMVSNATKEAVDEHLHDCADCSKELENLKKTEKLPVKADVSSLKRVGDSIRRRRILAVMAVFLFVATVLVGGALMLDAKIYLSANEAVEEIYVTEDGINIRWDDRITGTTGSVDRENPINYEVTAWTNLYNYLFYKGRVSYDDLGSDVKEWLTREQYEAMDNTSNYALSDPEGTNFIYVCPPKHSMTLILNGNQPLPEEPETQVQSDILYYVVGMIAGSVFCFIMGAYLKDKWFGELFCRIGLITGSLGISMLIVTAGQVYSLTGDFQEAIVDSSVVALPMGLFGLCVRQLMKLNRQDRGL